MIRDIEHKGHIVSIDIPTTSIITPNGNKCFEVKFCVNNKLTDVMLISEGFIKSVTMEVINDWIAVHAIGCYKRLKE